MHASPMPHAGSQGTSVVQVPLRQTWPPVQVVPQAPQFVALLPVSTHAPPQQARPPVHAGPVPHWHTLPAQVSPAPHAGSHGGATHAPSSQTCPGAQCMPQPPHAIVSVRTFTQRPSQHRSLPVQASAAPHRHVPVMHTFARPSQFIPQPPQSLSELPVLTHAPSQQVRPPSQGSSGEQPATHAPPRQIVPVGHVAGHPPASGRGGV
jgi:hypothetical protein